MSRDVLVNDNYYKNIIARTIVQNTLPVLTRLFKRIPTIQVLKRKEKNKKARVNRTLPSSGNKASRRRHEDLARPRLSPEGGAPPDGASAWAPPSRPLITSSLMSRRSDTNKARSRRSLWVMKLLAGTKRRHRHAKGFRPGDKECLPKEGLWDSRRVLRGPFRGMRRAEGEKGREKSRD